MDGGASAAWMRDAILALARAIPNAHHRTLEGQMHAVDPQALARAIEEFRRHERMSLRLAARALIWTATR
jgi:hypothetical protein